MEAITVIALIAALFTAAFVSATIAIFRHGEPANDDEIRDEMDADMEQSGMAQREIESCLNHWFKKYEIKRRK